MMKIHVACLPFLFAGTALLAVPLANAATPPASATYVAHLHALNTEVAGTATTGTVWFTISGSKGNKQLTIKEDVHGAPPNMVHWQHIHGFKNGKAAACAVPADVSSVDDTNHDGIIDITETGPVSGTTMIPLDSNPVGMNIVHGLYPQANAKGDYTYWETMSLSQLQSAFAKAFPGQKLDLQNRVVYVHGVPATTKLPATVKSLGSLPAQVVIPIACGVIERVDGKGP